MDKKLFNSIKKEYYRFEDYLSDLIIDSEIFLESEDCYLIEESWNKELLECFEKCPKKKKISDYNDFLPEYFPDFVNDFSSIFKNLKNNKKMKLVSRKLMKLIYEESDIKEYNIVKFYTGNFKIIIEYKENEDNKTLLLINNVNNINAENAFIISIKNEKKIKLFKNILSVNKNFNFESSSYYNKYIISFQKYINILKLFIYIYYYEKSLLDNKRNNFDDDDVYLINPKWLNIFKEYFNYSDLCNSLKTIKLNNNILVDYNNLNKHINRIISKNNILNALNLGKNELYDNIIDFKNIEAQIEYKKKILYIILIFILLILKLWI